MTLLGAGKRQGSCADFAERVLLRQDEWTFANSIRLEKSIRFGDGKREGEREKGERERERSSLPSTEVNKWLFWVKEEENIMEHFPRLVVGGSGRE